MAKGKPRSPKRAGGRRSSATKALPFDDAAQMAPPEGPAGTTLTLGALESHLWEAANILRGSPLGRTDWMSYILPLLLALRGFPWHAAADSWRADDWVECRNGHASIALRPFAWPR